MPHVMPAQWCVFSLGMLTTTSLRRSSTGSCMEGSPVNWLLSVTGLTSSWCRSTNRSRSCDSTSSSPVASRRYSQSRRCPGPSATITSRAPARSSASADSLGSTKCERSYGRRRHPKATTVPADTAPRKPRLVSVGRAHDDGTSDTECLESGGCPGDCVESQGRRIQIAQEPGSRPLIPERLEDVSVPLAVDTEANSRERQGQPGSLFETVLLQKGNTAGHRRPSPPLQGEER